MNNNMYSNVKKQKKQTKKITLEPTNGEKRIQVPLMDLQC